MIDNRYPASSEGILISQPLVSQNPNKVKGTQVQFLSARQGAKPVNAGLPRGGRPR
jgi:hypothetical protein